MTILASPNSCVINRRSPLAKGLVFAAIPGLGGRTGRTLRDLSGRHRNGTITGTEWSTPITSSGFGSLLYSANTDNADTRDVTIGSELTVCAWVRTSSTGTIQNIVCKDRTIAPLARDWQFRKESSEKVRFVGIGDGPDVTGATSISDGKPHFVCVTNTNATGTIYVDGKADGTATGTTLTDSGSSLMVGKFHGSISQTWIGEISDVWVFERCFTASQISVLYLESLLGYPTLLNRTRMYAGFVEVQLPPLNTVAPELTGTERVGETLSCATGTWDSQGGGTITYAYQWTRSDDAVGTGEANISGATSSTYVLTASDLGKYIRCVVTATNTGGSTAANSNFSGEILRAINPERGVSFRRIKRVSIFNGGRTTKLPAIKRVSVHDAD